jgi:saccharopine dehydrogenase-like NADP-dependent oxidoreductase
MMQKIAVIGAGHIGGFVAAWLQQTGDYQVTVGDANPKSAARIIGIPEIPIHQIDASQEASLRPVLTGQDAVISCCPAACNPVIVKLAKELGLHYFDPTEEMENAKAVQELAQDAKTVFAPQCGLAPGYISILAADMANRFDSLESIRLRVGSLPRYPTNRLRYNMTWSTDGLVNEYIYPCEAIVDGESTQLPPLENYETFEMDGHVFEAFNTSGGIGTLAETYRDRVQNLNYKTIRYPGHRDLITFLLDDMKLRDDKPALVKMFDQSIPSARQDVIVIFVTVTGQMNGRYHQESIFNRIFNQDIHDINRTAIQITTAGGICAVVDMVATGKIPTKGFLRQETIALPDFLNNRFGQYYK